MDDEIQVSQETLLRTIKLPSATFLIVGYVVGASIFILPGSLAPETGPLVGLAYLLAAIPAVFACFVMALVGGAFPASGSIYLLIRGALSPVLAFMYVWIMVSLAAVVIPLIASGFADYFAFFYSGINARILAMGVIAFFILINFMGTKFASGSQNVMVIGIIVALVIFSLGGIGKGDSSLMQPLLPHGYTPILVAAITVYFSYAGVFVIAEVAGEIENPGRTIPLAIFLSFAVIVVLYTAVPLALTRILPWETLGATPMAVVTAAAKILPGWLVAFTAIGALLAAATSINGIMMGLSRDFYKAATSGLFPRYFASIHPRFNTPGRAILVVGALSLAGAFAGGGIVQFAQIAVMGLMIVQILTGIALLRLPARMPEAYASSQFRLSPLSLRFICICYIAVSIVFLAVLGFEQPGAVLPGMIFLALGFAWYAVTTKLGGALKEADS